MRPLYESLDDDLEIYNTKSVHFSPHLHNFIEFVYITEGTLELGVGLELYHMEKGDFALIFPGQIHHAQVFDTGKCRSIHLLCAPSYSAGFRNTLTTMIPDPPVIQAASLHPDIVFALKSLLDGFRRARVKRVALQYPNEVAALKQAYVQLILARSLMTVHLSERPSMKDDDLVYQTVSYIGEHFTEQITLTSMARALYVSPYALSRIFSSTFHTNFNGYLNDVRLEYACSLLRYTDQTITDISGNAGYESQRTFNRVFQDKLHMTPRDYRNSFRESGTDHGGEADEPSYYHSAGIVTR